MMSNNVHDFNEIVYRALNVVQRILDTTKNPKLIEDADHEYDDKYSLVQFMTNTAIAAILNTLDKLEGFNEDVLREMIRITNDKNKSVTLRLVVETDCEFVEEKTITVESSRKLKTEIEKVEQDHDGKTKSTSKSKFTHKIVNDVKQYHWKVSIQHKMVLFSGTDYDNGVVVGSRKGTTTVITRMNENPYPKGENVDPSDLNLTWLFQCIDPSTMKCCFTIDREQAKTPRRNEQVEKALRLLENLSEWSFENAQGIQYLVADILGNDDDQQPNEKMATNYAQRLTKISSHKIFCPIVPLVLPKDASEADEEKEEEGKETKMTNLINLEEPPANSTLLPLRDMSKFLEEQNRSLETEIRELVACYPPSSDEEKIVTGYEAKLVLIWRHLSELARQSVYAIQYVEDVLRRQLIQAIGKEVNSKEFNSFQSFHNQRLFSKLYSPKPFCYAIRQPKQYPEGLINIVSGGPESKDSIETFVRHIPGDSLTSSISIPINAATTVEFVGDQYLHGWMDTEFASEPSTENFLIARARQFSCFLLAIGKISGPNEFTPKDAIILQNKDEVIIPLLLENLPSAKEFKDAIKSLSPEQARFAKSFRAMQLDSSVFGICVIQVRPQLEALLDLPSHSLTKEIQLTQDLLSLFVEYQIPPTLMSYDGPESASATDKVVAVKTHVKAVMDVIQGIKDNQLKEEVQRADMRLEMAQSFAPACDDSNIVNISRGHAEINEQSCVFRSRMARRVKKIPMASMACAQPAGDFNAYSCDVEVDMVTPTDGFEALSKKEFLDDLATIPSMEHQTDFTAIPRQLDQMFESSDCENALRTFVIKSGDDWKRKRQKNLLTKMQKFKLGVDHQKLETNKALDLLDALSRSGSLPIVSGELHVIIGVRHLFEGNVMDTVIKENVNPVEKVDYSSLLIASSVHNVNIPTLISDSVEPPTLVLSERKFPPLMMKGEESKADEE